MSVNRNGRVHCYILQVSACTGSGRRTCDSCSGNHNTSGRGGELCVKIEGLAPFSAAIGANTVHAFRVPWSHKLERTPTVEVWWRRNDDDLVVATPVRVQLTEPSTSGGKSTTYLAAEASTVISRGATGGHGGDDDDTDDATIAVELELYDAGEQFPVQLGRRLQHELSRLQEGTGEHHSLCWKRSLAPKRIASDSCEQPKAQAIDDDEAMLRSIERLDFCANELPVADDADARVEQVSPDVAAHLSSSFSSSSFPMTGHSSQGPPPQLKSQLFVVGSKVSRAEVEPSLHHSQYPLLSSPVDLRAAADITPAAHIRSFSTVSKLPISASCEFEDPPLLFFNN